MSNELTIIILGIYTLVYIIVFFIQKSQIDSQKTVMNSMKSFMDIFSVDELKKYVEVRTETMKLNLENHLENHKNEFRKDSEGFIRKILGKELDIRVDNIEENYNEICEAIYTLLLALPIDERPKFIEECLPLTGDAFIAELKNYNEWPNI